MLWNTIPIRPCSKNEEFIECCPPSLPRLDFMIRDYWLPPIPLDLFNFPATLVSRVWQFTHAARRISSPKGTFPLGDFLDFSNKVGSSCEGTSQRRRQMSEGRRKV